MKLMIKAKQKKQNIKNRQIEKSKKGHVLIVAQEIKFARLLSGNEKKSRDRVLKTLKKWLSNCFQKGYAFKEEDFTRVWKGLFYAVWMSDKPLVQEELCDNIGGILDQFPTEQFQYAVMMTKAGLRVLATEWFGIDQHRIDKFMMLVRRFLRGSLRCLQRSEWNIDNCKMYAQMLSNADGILAVKTPHYARNASSMVVHYIDCFLEELSKVSRGVIPETSLVELLRPFIMYMGGGACGRVVVMCRRLLTWLLRQSTLGLEYQQATVGWHQLGCPEGGPEALELVVEDDVQEDGNDPRSDDECDVDEKPLDPRAGRVDVELNPLPVPARDIAEVLRQQLRSASSKAHKRIKICMQRFEKLANQEYPLPIPESEWTRDTGPRISQYKSAASLAELDSKLKESADELALRGLSRKHRKRILAKSRSGVNIVEEMERAREKPRKKRDTGTTNGEWKVEESEPAAKKAKLNGTKKNKKKDKQIDKKRNIPSVDNKQQVEKIRKDKRKKAKEVLNGVEEKKAIKIVTDSKKSKLQPKDNKDTKENNEVAHTKVHKKSDVNDISKTKSTNAPKVIIHSKDKKEQNGMKKENTKDMKIVKDKIKATHLVNKVKNFQKRIKKDGERKLLSTPKKVKFVLKNNSMQGAVDYYKSVRQSPNIPYNPSIKPTKTNLKPSTPSPINPFFKKKLKLK